MGIGLKVSRSISAGLLAVMTIGCAVTPVRIAAAGLRSQHTLASRPLVPGEGRADRAERQTTRVIAAPPALSFEPNRGQADVRTRFLSRGSGYALYLEKTAAVLALAAPCRERTTRDLRPLSAAAKAGKPDSAIVRMEVVGGNRHSPVIGTDPLPGRVNYFIGNNPRKWRTNIPTYARVCYRDIYPGIDLAYYGKQRLLEYDFIVAPGQDPRAIRLRLQGARRVRIDRRGDLLVKTAAGTLRWQKPIIYQKSGGTRQRVAGQYVVCDKRLIGFRVAGFDRKKPLIIDPVLAFSTYLGGVRQDDGAAVAADSRGNAYVAGFTSSPDFPIANALEPQLHVHGIPSWDGFVTKIDTIHSTLVYSTYFGGESTDQGLGITVDSAGNAYVTGLTQSTDFPTVNALDSTLNKDGLVGGEEFDAFVLKLDPTGSALLYSTYLGGSKSEQGTGIAVDAAGNAYVTGWTNSYDFPTVNAAQGYFAGGRILSAGDSFVCKLNAAGSALVYSTYLGGTDNDAASGIAVDASGCAYIAGTTYSHDFPTRHALHAVYGGGPSDGFIAKLDPTGSAWVYSTYLGGNGSDQIGAIAVDTEGDAYVAGSTTSPDFPVANALQSRIAGTPDPRNGYPSDAFIAKLNPSGSALTFSTYLGGSGQDGAGSIALDSSGNVYVAGSTQSPDFPVVEAFQPSIGKPAGPYYELASDVFVAKLDNRGSRLIYSTYLGGQGLDFPSGIAVDGANNVYLTGTTWSTDFPLARPLQSALGGAGLGSGDSDVFVAKISDSAPSPPADTLPPVTQATIAPAPNDQGWNHTPVRVDLRAWDEGGSGVKEIRYMLTGAQQGSGLISGSLGSIRASTEGVSILTYHAVDNAGNQERAHTLSIRIDMTPPSGTVTTTPMHDGFWSNSPVTVRVHASDNPGGSGVKEIRYMVYGAQSDTGIVAADTLSVTISANGTTNLIAYPVDNAGNQGLPVGTTVAIDQVPPVTMATANPPPDPSGGNRTPVTVSLQASDMSIPYLMESGVKEMHYTLTGAQTGSAVVSGDHARVDVTADGITTLTYFAVDYAGNQESPKSLTLRIAGAGSQ